MPTFTLQSGLLRMGIRLGVLIVQTRLERRVENLRTKKEQNTSHTSDHLWVEPKK